MKVRFYIEKRNNDEGILLTKERPVFMTVAFHGKRVIIATGVRLDLQWWDSNLQRVRAEHPESFVLNAWLDSLSETATATWKALACLSDKPGVEEFRNLFSELKPMFSSGFFNIFYQFMNEKSNKWSLSTYRKVRTIYNHLREFERIKNYPLSFSRINDHFLSLFSTYYYEKGNSQITTYKAINIIAWFLNWATDKGYNTFRYYKGFYKLLSKSEPAPEKRMIFLTWKELMLFSSFYSEDRKLQRVQDLFCIICFSGLRFSELQNLKKQDIENKKIFLRSKHRKLRRIPLNNYAFEIVNKYENIYFKDNAAFPRISLITFNKYLKKLCEMAGIDTMTAGSAVNTFIANAIHLDIPPVVIANFTGIQRDSRYARLQYEISEKEIGKFDRISR